MPSKTSPVRTRLAAPYRSYSIKALHYIGNVETQDRYLVRAPLKPIPTPDVMTVPGLFLRIAQPGSAQVWGTWGRRFEPCYGDQFNAAVAHQVEQQIENLCVAGSSPARGTNYNASLVQLDRTPAYEAVRLGIRIPRDAPNNS